MIPYLIAGGAALVVVVLGLAIMSMRGDLAGKRLQAIQEIIPPAAASVGNIRRSESDSAIPTLDRAVKRFMPRREALRERLARTGREIAIGPYLLFSALIGLCITLLLIFVFRVPSVAGLLVGAAGGIGLPHFFIGWLGARRTAQFNALFPEAIDVLVRGLRSGMPIQDSIATISREIGEPVGGEFRRIELAIKFGHTIDSALWAAAKRIVIAEFQFFIVSMSVQRETGGNLAETLGNLSELLRRRRQMKLKIRAMSSEARASAFIIGALPFIMFFLILAVSPNYALALFRDSRGLIMVGGGLVSITLGALVMAKMVRFEI